MKYSFVYSFLVVLFLFSCAEQEITVLAKPKIKVQFSPLSIGQQFGTSLFSISFYCNTEDDRFTQLNEIGICWSNTNPNPTIKDNKFSSSISPNFNSYGSFRSDISTFRSDNTYFIKPYLVTSDSVYYGRNLSFSPLKCTTEIKGAVFNKLLTIPQDLDFYNRGFSSDSYFISNERLCFVNAIGKILRYNPSTNSFEFLNQFHYNFNAAVNQFDSFNNPMIFTIKGKIYSGFGTKNGSLNISNQVFEFDTKTDNWKELPTVDLDRQQNYKPWFTTDSSQIFITYTPRYTLWEYKPNKSTFQKLYEITDLAQYENPKSIQYQDKVIFVSKVLYVEKYSIFSFDFNTKSIIKMTDIDSFCGQNFLVQRPSTLFLQGDNLYLNSNNEYTLYDGFYANIGVFNVPKRVYDLKNNQWKASIHLSKSDTNSLINNSNTIFSIGLKNYIFEFKNPPILYEITLP